jgi:hypothetical protein
MGKTDVRMHHSINWKTCVPVIIHEKYKKKWANKKQLQGC